MRYGLIGALRFPADEVQFGRILHAICRQDGHVANGFCGAVLGEAAAGTHAARRRRASDLLDDLGDHPVRSMSERDLFVGSRGVLRGKARRQGRIDLSFEAAGSWKLGVELKFNDRSRRGQQERYPAVGRPVVFLVRDPGALAEPSLDPKDAKHYLGAVAWEALLPQLYKLPVRKDERETWMNVLRVSEINGDFARQQPRDTGTRHDAEILGRVAPAVQQTLAGLLQQKHNTKGRRFADGLTIDGPYAARTWANLGLTTAAGECVVWIDLRHTESSQPAWRISWPRRHPIIHRREYERLAQDATFRPSRDWFEATGTVSPAEWRTDPDAAVVRSMSEALTALVRSGVMGRLVASER